MAESTVTVSGEAEPRAERSAPPGDGVRPASAPGGSAAEVGTGRIGIGGLALIAVQLLLLALVIRQFQIESGAFVRLAMLAFAGFVVHALLPLAWRLPFFVLLSVGAIGMVLGARDAAWLLALGLVLIGACHLPVSFGLRVVLVLVLGAVFALQRSQWIGAPWSPVVWPLLGSMFMFRLAVYLYDLKHDSAPTSVWRTLAYFFLLPNVCFPLFPVVDYKTFRRNYFDADTYRIYQTGVDWMARGVLQLILYRFVYYYLVLPPSEVKDPQSFAQYVLANFLLYLRVSGQFHLVVGMLYLFGFRLPETHHRYFLSSSFTDFWRRINIYWKDFMLKLVYYPIYFRLRRLGPTAALVISTLLVFAATWALHAYQWFWLRGSFLLAGTDIAFWSLLAVLVVVNALRESRHGRVRTLGRARLTLQRRLGVGLRTAATFAVICLLWSLWTSESFTGWLALWKAIGEAPTPSAGLLLPVLAVVAIVALGAAGAGDGAAARAGTTPRRLTASTAVTVAMLAVLGPLGIQSVHTQLGPQVASVVHSLRSGQLSRVDLGMLERGYYEDLIRVDRFNSQLWQVYMNKPENWLDVRGLGLERFTGDFRQAELVPSFAAQTRFGVIRTNRWGMRDRDYAKVAPDGTYRFAMLGASTVMGWGVAEDEVFESLVESRLNQEPPGRAYARYEILNLAVPGYEPLQQLPMLTRALEFSPDGVLYVAIGRELDGAIQYLAEATRKRLDIPYEYLRDVARRAGVDATTDETTALRRLAPFRGDVLSWTYGEIVRACRERKVVPVFVFLPQTYRGAWERDVEESLTRARDAGFVVLDLKDAFRDADRASLRLAEWDAHPNPKGHRVMAAGLYEALARQSNQIFVSREARQ